MSKLHHLTSLFFLFLLSAPPPTTALPSLRQWRTLTSLSNSLLTRVANARAARGDVSGAARLRRLADHLRLLGGGERGSSGLLSLSWDYFWNYYSVSMELPFGDISRLVRKISEASRARSGEELSRWIFSNYDEIRVLGLKIIKTLLTNFSKSGPLREAVMELKKEVAEGELLRDCLEIGARDLEGLLQIAKDLFSSHSGSDSSRDSEL
ncbi:hypothetical protein LUZ60_000497 [Juncus effusus]|nr:hypothetical protein LUZ60_000497 [Juncus effusus]